MVPFIAWPPSSGGRSRAGKEAMVAPLHGQYDGALEVAVAVGVDNWPVHGAWGCGSSANAGGRHLLPGNVSLAVGSRFPCSLCLLAAAHPPC